jgi:transposase
MEAVAADRGGCRRCRELQRTVAMLLARVAALESQLAATQAELAAARKTSATSSKPPSSDLVKPPKTRTQRGRRKRGAQPGHPRHERPAFGPDEITHVEEHRLECCPECGGALELLDEPARVQQQVEVAARPVEIVEHRSRVCRCRKCQQEFTTPIPKAVQAAGLVGPQLTALVGYLKGACHCSFSTIRRFLRDVLQVTISRGQLRKLCGKVADSLDAAYQQLLAALPTQQNLNIDETGHKENGQGLWTWCFRAPRFTLFQIDPSRGSEVLVQTLGTAFAGVIGCDYFSAYRKYLRLNAHVLLQFCLAHLIRDVKFLVEHPHSRNRAYGKRVLAALRELFAIIHRRASYRSERAFRGALEDQGVEVWAQATFRVPPTKEARNLAERFRQHGQEYLRFITTPGVEPTNNLAEQAIRFVVLDRKVTQGTRSATGRKWCERIWTTIATCTQHGRDLLAFLTQSLEAHFAHRPGPALLPESS